jgi:hypothetical protein
MMLGRNRAGLCSPTRRRTRNTAKSWRIITRSNPTRIRTQADRFYPATFDSSCHLYFFSPSKQFVSFQCLWGSAVAPVFFSASDLKNGFIQVSIPYLPHLRLQFTTRAPLINPSIFLFFLLPMLCYVLRKKMVGWA